MLGAKGAELEFIRKTPQPPARMAVGLRSGIALRLTRILLVTVGSPSWTWHPSHLYDAPETPRMQAQKLCQIPIGSVLN